MQQCHKINGTWSSFRTKTLEWHVTQVVPCDTRESCRLVKSRVSIQQRWHGGLLLVRVFGKLCCHPPSSPPPPTTPTPPPPFSSANFSLRILLLLQMWHLIWGHFLFSSKQRLARGSCYKASEMCRMLVWVEPQKYFCWCCVEGNRTQGHDYEIIIIRLTDS